MMNELGRPSLGTSAIDGDAWNRGTFGDLIDLIGARVANNLAMRFRSDLCNRFADVTNRELVRRDAHAVTSTSEVLGFTRLSQAARLLEAACGTGEAIDFSLQALMIAKVDSILALNDSLAPEWTTRWSLSFKGGSCDDNNCR
jgi:hypothetical protein